MTLTDRHGDAPSPNPSTSWWWSRRGRAATGRTATGRTATGRAATGRTETKHRTGLRGNLNCPAVPRCQFKHRIERRLARIAQPKPRQPERAVQDAQLGFSPSPLRDTTHIHHAYPVDQKYRPGLSVRAMVFVTASRESRSGRGGRPRRPWPGVMMSALGLVEGIAPPAVVPVADVPDAGQALIDQALVDHADGRGVLETGHDLGEVGEGISGAVLRVGRHEQRRLVAEDVGPP